MSPTTTRLPIAGLSFPRVSGDEPQQQTERLIDMAFSPRERG